MNKSISRKIAFGGIFTALAVIFVYFAGIMPTGKLTLYALSSLPVAFAIIEFGVSTGTAVYIAAAILSSLFLGNIKGAFPFILFFGHYAIDKFYIEKNRAVAVEILFKLGAFNASLLLGYTLFRQFISPELLKGLLNTKAAFAILIVAAQLAFLAYDYVFTRLIQFYQERMRGFKDKM